MITELSEFARFLVHNYYEVHKAVDRFWWEWGDILDQVVATVSDEVRGTDWSCCREGSLVKLYKSSWPAPQTSSVHLEIDPNTDEAWKHAKFWVALHLEDSLPDKDATTARLKQLLDRYRTWIEGHTHCQIRDPDDWRVLAAQLSMDKASVREMSAMLSRLLPLGVLVDETLAVPHRTRLWRTDFRPGDMLPDLERDGDSGGQRFDGSCGLLGSPGLIIDGRKTNSMPGWDPPRNRALLVETKELAPGDDVYFSVTLRARARTELRIYAAGYRRSQDKDVRVETGDCVRASVELDPLEEWQHVVWRGHVNALEDFNHDSKPLHLYLFVLTEDKALAINSIELGKVNP